MMVLKVLLYFIEIVAGLLLVGVILIQKSKDEGLGVAFGGQMGESLFGSRAGNVLTKITIVLGAIFLVNTLLIGRVVSKGSGGAHESLMSRVAPVPAHTVPAGGMGETPAPVPAAAALPALPAGGASAVPAAAAPVMPAAAAPTAAPIAPATPSKPPATAP